MKKHLLFIVLLAAAAGISAQTPDYSRKFGKVTDYELDMTSYIRDTSAVAVYLYEDTQVFYTPMLSDSKRLFQQTREYFVKIKILKPEGVSLADVEIQYHVTADIKEYVSGISATAYNKVDGKVVKTPIKSKDIFTEQFSETIQLRKFSIPEVRVGTVIEYKYTIASDYYWVVDPIRIQHEYPVVCSFSEVSTPEYFRFNMSAQGYHPVVVKPTKRSKTNYFDDVRTCVAMDVPALKDEPYVWSIDDFRTKLTFELESINLPGYYKSYSETWQSVNERLDKSNFALNLKISNPLKDEVAAIKAEGGEEAEQIRKILKLVTSRMTWDGKYTIWSQNARQKLRDGVGSSGDINFVLNSALRDAGFNTTPVLLTPRQYGRLPLSHPSMDNIRTFIVEVGLSDGSAVYVDGTSSDNDLNLIPSLLMVDRARLYGISNEAGWVNLTNLTPNDQRLTVKCQIDENGNITGTLESTSINAIAAVAKSKYRAAGSEEEYVEKMESENNMEISSYKISALNEPSVDEKIDFTMKAEKGGDYIYFSSTIVPIMTKNRLTQQERKLPVEFSTTAKYTITALVVIPEGYVIEEVPKAVRMNACNNGASYMYYATANGNILTIQMEYTINRVIFTPKEYPDLHTFMGMMVEKNNSRIILKKI